MTTLPIRKVIQPTSLKGRANGRLPADILRSVTTKGGTATLVTPAHTAWLALVEAAERAGHVLVPFSSYRSFETQERLFLSRYKLAYKAGVDTKQYQNKTWFLHSGYITAAPGTSNHGWGLALDVKVRRNGELVSIDRPDDPTLLWLIANEHLYGFSHELQPERWHIRYWAGDHPPITQPIPEDDDMPLTPEDLDAIGARVQAELKKGTGTGQLDWPSTNRAILGTIQSVSNIVTRLASQPPTNVNVGALAAEMVDLMDDDLAAAVANELARRLGD